MVEVLDTVEMGETKLVKSVPVVLGIGGTVPYVKELEYDSKGGGGSKVAELLETSCFNRGLCCLRFFGT